MTDIRLLHGDCLQIMKTFTDGEFDAIITDVPYGEANRNSNGLRNLDKGKADVTTFKLLDFLKTIDRICSGSFYIFCGFQQISEIDNYFRNHDISRRCIVWEKTNPSPMNGKSIWLSGIELCAYGKKSGAVFNGFCRNTVLRHPCGRNKLHPTQKDLNMIKDLIQVSTNKGDIVLDPCMGSGTTMEACYKTGRRGVGIEIDKGSYDIACKRVAEAQMQPRLL